MAVTVLSGSPQVATPVYNKMLFKVSSDQIAQPNYRFVCDVKDSAGSTYARLKCDKLPITNQGFFDVAKVVETLIAPTKPSLTQTAFSNHSGYYSGYRLDFFDEYGNTPVVQTGTVTTVSGNVAFAGNLEQLEFQSYNSATRFPSGTLLGSLALTTPTRFVWHSNTEARWLAQGKGTTTANFDKALIRYYTAGGTLTRVYTVNNGQPAVQQVVRFGAGPSNIRALTSGQASDGFSGEYLFPSNEGEYYTIAFGDSAWNDFNQRCDADGADPAESSFCLEERFNELYEDNYDAFGQEYTYIKGLCERFNSIPVHFQNKWGGLDAYVFTLKNRKRANITRQTFGYNSDVYATTTYDKVWAGEFDYVYALNSDWLTDAESAWLIEMVRSGQVWLELDGQLVEAIVNANTYQFTTRRNDRLTQLQVEVAVAYKNNIL